MTTLSLFSAVDYIEGLAAKYEPGTVFFATAAEIAVVDNAPVVYVTFFQDGANKTGEAVATVWVENYPGVEPYLYGEW